VPGKTFLYPEHAPAAGLADFSLYPGGRMTILTGVFEAAEADALYNYSQSR